MTVMKLFSEKEFETSKSNDLLKCRCEPCGKIHFLTKRAINCLIRKSKVYNRRLYLSCSRKCATVNGLRANGKDLVVPKLVSCKNCNKNFYKLPKEIKKSNNNFCSRSCSATFNNTHKKYGHRKSKLESWLADALINLFPDLEFKFNEKSTINSELDIYIPKLNLAFELNGIFHYEPIFGTEKLKKIQNNDNRKFQACLENGIELCIIDTSRQTYFKEKTSIQFLEIIKNLINLKLATTRT